MVSRLSARIDHTQDRKFNYTEQKCGERIFSQPVTAHSVWGGTVKHDGVTPGYLYTVADEIGPDDVYPHPHPVNATRWEWLTNRELKLKLIEQTIVTDEERLTDQEIAEMKRKQEERGERSFVEEDV